ncbi:MAG TPA: T9SS type A sorting domain-containing protein [Flavipsychrobacter sp.]|nr:T9SS type A sorting domain-containing protein [Flavipsychrobacter sp.]
MKKLFLLMAAGSVCLNVSAQQANQLMHSTNQNHRMQQVDSRVGATKENARVDYSHLMKTTATVFQSENFSTGSGKTPPPGWLASGGWDWRNSAPVGYYTRGIIAAPATATNGYVCYRADSISSFLPTTILTGTLTSPSYSCTGHTKVGLRFYNWYTNFQDSCFVDVSNNNGATWTTFPVFPNNNLAPNEALPVNPTRTTINISAVAANQANVKIRFNYQGRAGGAYQWLVDDMELIDMDPVDVAIDKGGVIMSTGTAYTGVGGVPKTFVDTLWPLTLASNFGGDPQTNMTVNNAIYNAGGTSVLSLPYTFPAFPINAYDSLTDVTGSTGLITSTVGNYTAVSSVNVTGDVDATNNRDTTMFAITDSVWYQESGTYKWAYWAHSSPAATQGEESQFIGTRYAIPAGKSDTLTHINVAFLNTTTPGVTLSVQMYQFSGGAWTPFASTYTKTLTAADISASGQVSFARFTIDETQSGGPVILGNATAAQTVAAVVQLHNVPSTSTVRIWGTDGPAFSILGQGTGLTDTSNNNGAFDFPNGTLPFTLGNSAPAIRLVFGTRQTVSVKDVYAAEVGNAYPNPANNTINIPFQMNEAANVNVVITNSVGATVTTKNVGNFGANQAGKAVIDVTSYANGVYFYTVEANGQRITKRFTVTH